MTLKIMKAKSSKPSSTRKPAAEAKLAV